MELLNFFDEYDRNARIVPGLINAIPTISTVIYCFPGVQGSAAAVVGSGLVSLSVIYLLALTVRFLGARIEPKLWEAWGGALLQDS